MICEQALEGASTTLSKRNFGRGKAAELYTEELQEENSEETASSLAAELVREGEKALQAGAQIRLIRSYVGAGPLDRVSPSVFLGGIFTSPGKGAMPMGKPPPLPSDLIHVSERKSNYRVVVPQRLPAALERNPFIPIPETLTGWGRPGRYSEAVGIPHPMCVVKSKRASRIKEASKKAERLLEKLLEVKDVKNDSVEVCGEPSALTLRDVAEEERREPWLCCLASLPCENPGKPPTWRNKVQERRWECGSTALLEHPVYQSYIKGRSVLCDAKLKQGVPPGARRSRSEPVQSRNSAWEKEFGDYKLRRKRRSVSLSKDAVASVSGISRRISFFDDLAASSPSLLSPRKTFKLQEQRSGGGRSSGASAELSTAAPGSPVVCPSDGSLEDNAWRSCGCRPELSERAMTVPENFGCCYSPMEAQVAAASRYSKDNTLVLSVMERLAREKRLLAMQRAALLVPRPPPLGASKSRYQWTRKVLQGPQKQNVSLRIRTQQDRQHTKKGSVTRGLPAPIVSYSALHVRQRITYSATQAKESCGQFRGSRVSRARKTSGFNTLWKKMPRPRRSVLPACPNVRCKDLIVKGGVRSVSSARAVLKGAFQQSFSRAFSLSGKGDSCNALSVGKSGPQWVPNRKASGCCSLVGPKRANKSWIGIGRMTNGSGAVHNKPRNAVRQVQDLTRRSAVVTGERLKSTQSITTPTSVRASRLAGGPSSSSVSSLRGPPVPFVVSSPEPFILREVRRALASATVAVDRCV